MHGNNHLERPIPNLAMPNWEALAGIAIDPNSEPLCPLSLAQPALKVYPIYHHLGIAGALTDCPVREGVYRRLLRAAQALPASYQLVILDGWRPVQLQCQLFESLCEVLAKALPQLSEEQLEARARSFVSPPSEDPASPSPHLTGGAVDVTLADEQGVLLDMGSAFDEVTERSSTAYYEGAERSAEVRERRRILYWTMHSAGFSNLPSEWWHYDYGDQLWAWYREQPQALYGPATQRSLSAQWREQIALGEM
ncbi:MAG: M15 family metallopeptidase [Pseudomonadales bacterium]